MQFFSAVGAREAPENPVRPVPPWLRPPAGEIPIPLAVPRILARGPGSAVSLRRVDAHSNGCPFRL